ncbi:MAG: protease inhibitor I42 family protein [Phycisphaera sp.]|nr:protease inhibitor I42 family protein [Phycisphaera sp.]
MFRSHLFTLVLISAATLLPACAANSRSFETDSVEAIHPDAVTEITIDVGEAVTLMLPGNAGTGYDWVLAGDLPGFLRQRGDARFVAKDASKVGSQGDTRFVFEAIEGGEATVRFHYLRAWKKDAKPARWAEAAITAGSAGG